jgi:hypothetical protein
MLWTTALSDASAYATVLRRAGTAASTPVLLKLDRPG